MKAMIITQQNLNPNTAMAQRQLSIAKLLIASGYDTELIGIDKINIIKSGYIDGIKYTLLPNIQNKYIQFIFRDFIFCNNVMNTLTRCMDKPDIIHVTGIPLISFLIIKNYTKKHNMIYSHDSVEWFSLDECIGKYYFNPIEFISWIRENIRILYLIKSPMLIISISNYLYQYFTKKNISSMKLPICFDLNLFETKKASSNSTLKITYAGSPGRKDYLKDVVLSISTLTNEERGKIDFTLLGADLLSLSKLCGCNETDITNLQCIHACGKVPREEVLQRLKETDFTILIRSSTARYAKAGFPTKVVESLMSSTPVILNMTSDLGMYLKDGYDCIEVEHEDPESITKALRRALALTPEQKDVMKRNARKTAEKYFDYRLYIDEFGKFLKSSEK